MCAGRRSSPALRARSQSPGPVVYVYLYFERVEFQPAIADADCHDFEFGVLRALLGIEHFHEHEGPRVLTMKMMSSGDL